MLDEETQPLRLHQAAHSGAIFQDSFFIFWYLAGERDMQLDKMINKGTNKEQKLRIFKIRFYCAEISEQDIFQSVLLFLKYLFDRLMFQAGRKIK